MKAVILAAGTATRLRPLTDSVPKCLLPVKGKSILSRTLDNIIPHHLEQIIIVTGYRSQQIREFVLSAYPAINVKFIHNDLYNSTNNIYSLWLTKKHVLGSSLLLLDSDIIFDKPIITSILTYGHENCLALKIHAVQDEEIKVKADKNGKVLEIGKKVKIDDSIGESIGIEKFGTRFVTNLFQTLDFEILIAKNVNAFYESAFQTLINSGEDIFTLDVTQYNCFEIDTISDYETVNDLNLESTGDD
ncbi:MAG: phosphocholine cytidylyltransferase family protein [Saprospiraceae bacterium]